MPKPTTAVEDTSLKVVIVTMDSHVASTTDSARLKLSKEIPGLELNVHAASEFTADPAKLRSCLVDIADADIIVGMMLFLEEHFQPLLPALIARRENCDAMVCAMSAGEVTKLTRMGKFDMSAPTSGPMALLKKLRGSKPKEGSAGSNQMAMLRRIPKLLRFVPGTAQDVRAYFLTVQ